MAVLVDMVDDAREGGVVVQATMSLTVKNDERMERACLKACKARLRLSLARSKNATFGVDSGDFEWGQRKFLEGRAT